MSAQRDVALSVSQVDLLGDDAADVKRVLGAQLPVGRAVLSARSTTASCDELWLALGTQTVAELQQHVQGRIVLYDGEELQLDHRPGQETSRGTCPREKRLRVNHRSEES